MAGRSRNLGLLALAAVLAAVALAVPPIRTPPPAPAPTLAPDAAVAPSPPSASATPSAEPPPVDDAAYDYDIDALPIPEQREAMLRKMEFSLGLDAATLAKLRAIVTASDWMSQGNPEISKHPMTRAECRERRRVAAKLAAPEPRCGAANMVPLTREGHAIAPAQLACIDQYEFPNVACEYPVVWVRADEASGLCRAMGKRLCDAHEWEGACAGEVKDPRSDYHWDKDRINAEYAHNLEREIVWAYGPKKNHALCATGAKKSPKCLAGGFTLCGTNDYPAGAFPECVSPLGVYDQHGNAAEHMSLPMKWEELGSLGGTGETEMKGSWFIFQQAEAHLDDCRFRAPRWHVTKVTDPNSHRNYHLGFRCCRDVPARNGTNG
ncbi:MAG TPA: SUMF1/EgtB/PvdO family nonheme iron enzyme [Polyangiaceae bacterium]